MSRLLIGTSNAHKLGELTRILAGIPFALTSLAEAGIVHEVAEVGSTYAENAAQKARAYAAMTGLLSLADDSGLEVDALGGGPGVISARYAGVDATSQQRIAKLLRNLEGVPWESRQARFVCVMAISTPQGDVHFCEGTCSGVMTFAPRGKHGFGYDPVFYLPAYGATMAELDEMLKDQISHRGRAGEAAVAFLSSLPTAFARVDTRK